MSLTRIFAESVLADVTARLPLSQVTLETTLDEVTSLSHPIVTARCETSVGDCNATVLKCFFPIPLVASPTDHTPQLSDAIKVIRGLVLAATRGPKSVTTKWYVAWVDLAGTVSYYECSVLL